VKVNFDEKRAREVFQILENGWQRRNGIFNGIVLPQDRWDAPVDNREHANWLFYTALPMRGGIMSEEPFKWMWKLKQRFPELFEPAEIAGKWTLEKMKEAFIEVTAEILNGNGVGEMGAGALSWNMDEHIRSWHKNSVVLSRYWGSDIRNIFWGVTEFEEAFRRVDHYHVETGFKGMRRKIFSLLTIWLQERNLIPLFPTPIPIDFHALRILWGTEVLKLNGLAKPFNPASYQAEQLRGKTALRISEKFMDAIAKWSQKFIHKSGFSHMNINPAIWVLSRSMCSEHVQTSSKKDGSLYAKADLLKNVSAWPKKYKDPCSYCPVEKWCKWAIPAAPYYRWGMLVRAGKRVLYPVMKLPGLGEFFNSRRNKRR